MESCSRLVLASKSPRRRLLLQQLGIPFEIVDSAVSEKPDAQLDPAMVAQSLAERKARTPIITGGGVVIGADTLILLNGSILGKPTDEEDARRMLARLRGSSHHVITGLALIDSTTGKAELASVSTLVRMRSYSDSEIANYIASGEPMDKAGAYAIQEMGGAFVEGIQGCYNNVVGLPLCEISRQLTRFGFPLNANQPFCKLPSGQQCPRHEGRK